MFKKQYAQVYDQINSAKDYKREIEQVYKWAGNPKTLLDIGCGTAHYWKYLPKSCRVEGIDKSRAMINQSLYKNKITLGNIHLVNVIFSRKVFDAAISMFDVINYMPDLLWLKDVPVKKGGYFIFDVWDYHKIRKEGFGVTRREVGTIRREISPILLKQKVILEIDVVVNSKKFREAHMMYLHTHEDIKKAIRGYFKLVRLIPTDSWQTFYKLKRI